MTLARTNPICAFALVAFLGMELSCAGTRSVESAITIDESDDFETNLAVAKAVVTAETVAWLKAEVARERPELTDKLADALYLRWDVRSYKPVTTGEATKKVLVTVGFRDVGDGSTGTAVVKQCRELLAERISAGAGDKRKDAEGEVQPGGEEAGKPGAGE